MVEWMNGFNLKLIDGSMFFIQPFNLNYLDMVSPGYVLYVKMFLELTFFVIFILTKEKNLTLC
ncbi:MAG: hypothetical protein COW85_15475 [Ignavibacteria bacterium CG22_combo_CG10-13_8_21_14_all_37_15]|nr:MAG: hypothetical protein COW85_15475 [Ignavibacteria bacterium CG22_combo_CG10-13_8_21_14_all_37_15]